jgi:hypothetical protein
MTNLLDKKRVCLGGDFLRESFALLFEAFKADFQDLVQVELLFEGGKELGRGSGFAKSENGFEELGAAFKFAEAGFGRHE